MCDRTQRKKIAILGCMIEHSRLGFEKSHSHNRCAALRRRFLKCAITPNEPMPSRLAVPCSWNNESRICDGSRDERRKHRAATARHFAHLFLAGFFEVFFVARFG